MTPSTFIKTSLILFLLPLALFARKDSPILIKDVEFQDIKVKDDQWIEVEIHLQANTAFKYEFQGQRSDKFLDNIKLTFSLAYKTNRSDAGSFEFYESSVEIVSLQKGNDRYVYFYLPGVIRERDALTDDPAAWAVKFEISGKELPSSPKDYPDHFSRTLKNDELVSSFYKNLQDNIERNKGMLLPSYFAPSFVSARSKNILESANYLRRHPEK